ncbi:MAG: hypothetical protein JST81_13570 [Bacteroidetes bacterium]|jgi:hypothetical protein|nr:hypothetical protein [Bacteroidota bacterium]
MKNLFLLLIGSLVGSTVMAQLKTTPLCPEITINIMEGNINNVIQPNSTQGLIEKTFPCYTGDEPEGDSSKCGGTVTYADKDLVFYTGRDYIEIRQNFKGKLSIPLLGAARSSLFQWLGYPKIKDVQWDAFQTAYGILILYYGSDSKVNKIQMSTKSVNSIKLCD